MKTFDEFLQQEIEREGKRNLPHLIHSLGPSSKKLPQILKQAADAYASYRVEAAITGTILYPINHGK